MNQLDRDKRAVRTILSQIDKASMAEIALRGGEGLGRAVAELVRDGEVICHEYPDGEPGFQFMYSLAVD